MLPDRSLIKEQKLVENAKIETLKCDILSKFQGFQAVFLRFFYLDFNLIESLAVVNANNGTSHLRNDNHIAQVCLDNVRFLIGRTFLLLLTQFLDQSQRLTFKTTTDFPPDTARKQLHQLFIAHVKELIQIDSTVGKLTESPLFLQLRCCSLKKLTNFSIKITKLRKIRI